MQAFLRRARDDSGMAGSCQQDREAIQPIHGAHRGRPDQESVQLCCSPGAVQEGLRQICCHAEDKAGGPLCAVHG